MPDKEILIGSIKAGDIVLFHGATGVAFAQGAVQLLKIATVVPALASAAQTGSLGFGGNIAASHVGLVIEGGANSRFAHATLGAMRLDDLTNHVCKFTPERVQHAYPWIYRPTRGGLGRDAAEVATLWCQPGLSGQVSYGVGKAVASVFHSSSFGSGAKGRAQIYRQARMTRGGPHGALAAHSSTFCSAFVIACFQACQSEALAASNMALDAIHTSPATLQNYLATRGGWTYMGRLSV